jgi:hypothetical protein
MEDYRIYIVEAEEKLSSIAEKYGTTPEKIKALNPDMRTFGGFIGSVYVSVGQRIKIPGEEKKKPAPAEEETKRLAELQFDKTARYRCEQFNTTKVEENITYHCDTKKEYVFFKCINQKDIVRIILKDYMYKINPQNFAHAIEATKELEFDKENVIFSLNENGTIRKVVNYEEIKRKWGNFKPKLIKTDFYNEILKQNSKAAEDIVRSGDLEFNAEENLRKTYDKNLFYHVFFNNYETEIPQILKFLSQIFVNVELELTLSHVKKETENFVQYKTTGTLQKENLNKKLLEEQYDKFYKPIILYGFTDYDYKYQIIRNINKKTGLLSDAHVILSEAVKNNYQIITQFDLRQVEL